MEWGKVCHHSYYLLWMRILIENSPLHLKTSCCFFILHLKDRFLAYVVCSVAQSCLILCYPMDYSLPGSWNFRGKNTGVSYHFLFQGIFPTQVSSPCFLRLLLWQVDSLPRCHWEAHIMMGIKKTRGDTLQEKNLRKVTVACFHPLLMSHPVPLQKRVCPLCRGWVSLFWMHYTV